MNFFFAADFTLDQRAGLFGFGDLAAITTSPYQPSMQH